MSLRKPKLLRVYVLLTDPENGKTKGFTVYNRSLEDAFEQLRKQFEEVPQK